MRGSGRRDRALAPIGEGAAYNPAVLVGRQPELEALSDLLRGDEPVVVLGEPGIGKTALLRAALERSERRHRVGGALASLSWMAYVPLARAVGTRRLLGDPAGVAQRVRAALADDELLVLEDLHWADDGTVGVLELLVRSVPIVASARPADATELLERLDAVGFTRLELGPLDETAAATLVRNVRPEASDVTVSRIVRRCGGVPLLLSQLAGPEGAAGESLRMALGARLRDASPGAGEAFAVLAVLGRPVDEDAIGADVVANLERAGLVARSPEGIAVAHAVLGELAVARLDRATRAAVHRRAAELVTDAGEAARHLEAAGEPGAARELALQAAAAADGAAGAASHIAVAARCSRGTEADELRLRAANGLVLGLRHAEALTLLDAVEGTDATTLAERAILRSRALWYVGDDDGFRASIQDAVTHGAAAGDPLWARALVERSRVPIFLDPAHEPDGVTMAREGLAAATAAGIPIARAEMLLGVAHYMRDEPAWQVTLEGALRRARAEADVDTELVAANNLITAHESSGDPGTGRRLATEMVDRAGHLGMVGWQLQFRAMLLNLDLHAAEYAAAVRQAVELLDEPLDARARAQVLTALVFSLVELGRFDVVDDRLRALEADHAAPVAAESLRWLQAEAALHGGRPAEARRLANEAIELGMSDPFAAIVERWAAAELGERPAPLDAVEVPMFRGVHAESLGIAALAGESHAEAAAHFDHAARQWETYHRRGALRCRWAAAESVRRAGDVTAARARLTDLESELAARGMAPLLARTHRSLRALGDRRAVRRRRGGGHGLTEREAEVLRLVAGGLSNAEIGRRLRLSRSTVNEVIGRARERLGAASRGQAAALLVR
jgi:DNA-binding CsgD family transcriptional regulator